MWVPKPRPRSLAWLKKSRDASIVKSGSCPTPLQPAVRQDGVLTSQRSGCWATIQEFPCTRVYRALLTGIVTMILYRKEPHNARTQEVGRRDRRQHRRGRLSGVRFYQPCAGHLHWLSSSGQRYAKDRHASPRTAGISRTSVAMSTLLAGSAWAHRRSSDPVPAGVPLYQRYHQNPA